MLIQVESKFHHKAYKLFTTQQVSRLNERCLFYYTETKSDSRFSMLHIGSKTENSTKYGYTIHTVTQTTTRNNNSQQPHCFLDKIFEAQNLFF